jgi:hypothetical protein
MKVRPALFTIIVFFLHRIFVSNTHALAVLPNIARFTLDKKLPCAFIIITYGSREGRQTVCSGKVMGKYGLDR